MIIPSSTIIIYQLLCCASKENKLKNDQLILFFCWHKVLYGYILI